MTLIGAIVKVLAKSCDRTAGEGLGRTARMYVSEESDRGVVPVNHSNKDGFPSAEDGEGRLRIKENTFSFDTYPTLSGTARVKQVASVRTSGMLDRYSSAIRAACAKERSCGSVRGAISDGRPYRDLTTGSECKHLWLLKNSFDRFSAQNLNCKLLNFGSAGRRKVADITSLVPFSTPTPDYASFFLIARRSTEIL